MPRQRKEIPGVDPKNLIKEAAQLLPDPARRAFLRGGASLGAVAFLAGCDVIDGASAENALRAISRFNDGAQALLFNPNRLAPGFPANAHTRPLTLHRLLRRRRRAGCRRPELRVESRGSRAGEKILDAPRALRPAAGEADHAARVRRRLERDRQLVRRATFGLSCARRH